MEYGVTDFFEHECEEPGCTKIVPYDDEPKCFIHSPDSGSFVQGYSAKKELLRRELLDQPKTINEET